MLVCDQVVSLLKARGVEKIGCVGFCWGGKMIAHMAADPQISAGRYS